MVSDQTSTEKPPEQSPVALKRRSRKLTPLDIDNIADLVVKYRMTETEACERLGIQRDRWFTFKQRNKTLAKFDQMINRIRASQLENCIGSINRAGDDREFEQVTKSGKTVTITKPGDWRAKAWIAERVLAPERLGQQQSNTQVNVALVNTDELGKILAKVYSEPAKAVIDAVEVKALPEPKPIV